MSNNSFSWIPKERTSSFIVLAKNPIPGKVKTRLQSTFSAHQAAALAKASLTDTLETIVNITAQRYIISLDDTSASKINDVEAISAYEIIDQGQGNLAQRLNNTFSQVINSDDNTPTLLVGMDTPQITPEILTFDWSGYDAVLGLSPDGGYWAIGLRRSNPKVFIDIPMSQSNTGSEQLKRLHELGMKVYLLPQIRDIDYPQDAGAVAALAPQTRFGKLYTEFTSSYQAKSSLELLERAFEGRTIQAKNSTTHFVLNGLQWSQNATATDESILDYCVAPVLDVGCGPGRMVSALLERNVESLGIDISSHAISVTKNRGGKAIRRRIQDKIPREGQWNTILLADGNIGIDGDPYKLLTRCKELLSEGGRIVAEVDLQEHLYERDAFFLEDSQGRKSSFFPWARLGSKALESIATKLDLRVIHQVVLENRCIIVLQ